ncbi:WbqC family protein [Sphingobacterium sp. N143]|uniref:WbqC family protein n=1 Tax=Sphingobacterium sp. N143 TaxID=2746727 RepID=UPI002577A9E1|nr:WbqC family protein [Sphingobacterium sp. N143]MDM1296631.1 WbqC family protein [Sphingobacterium sp. N143]
MESQLLLPACYLPPVSYFHIIQENSSPLVIEQYEHFQKQSYRTRARIASANGTQDLIVPIQHGNKDRVPMKDIRISYEFDWQRLHWLSIQTAYRSSAYFEYYEDDFVRFYREKFEYLLDFNVAQLELLLKSIKLKRTITLTAEYNGADEHMVDYRERIHPKKASLLDSPKEYYQVFSDKNGFYPDLSIIDLLFNQGPQSKSYL